MGIMENSDNVICANKNILPVLEAIGFDSLMYPNKRIGKAVYEYEV